MPNSEELSVEYQTKKHLKTYIISDRYNVELDLEDISPRQIGADELMYKSDGKTASVWGDIRTTDSVRVKNAAAFLDSELDDQDDMVTWF